MACEREPSCCRYLTGCSSGRLHLWQFGEQQALATYTPGRVWGQRGWQPGAARGLRACVTACSGGGCREKSWAEPAPRRALAPGRASFCPHPACLLNPRSAWVRAGEHQPLVQRPALIQPQLQAVLGGAQVGAGGGGGPSSWSSCRRATLSSCRRSAARLMCTGCSTSASRIRPQHEWQSCGRCFQPRTLRLPKHLFTACLHAVCAV